MPPYFCSPVTVSPVQREMALPHPTGSPWPPLCKGRWHGTAMTEGLIAETIIKFYLSCPAGDSLQSPVGVAEFYKRYSFVRLPGVGLLFCEEK